MNDIRKEIGIKFSLIGTVEKNSWMMWAGHSVWKEEGQVTRCGRRRARSLGVEKRRARSLGVEGGGPGHSVWNEEGQVTRCGRRKVGSLGVDGGGPGHSVWTEEGQVTRCGRRRVHYQRYT